MEQVLQAEVFDETQTARSPNHAVVARKSLDEADVSNEEGGVGAQFRHVDDHGKDNDRSEERDGARNEVDDLPVLADIDGERNLSLEVRLYLR